MNTAGLLPLLFLYAEIHYRFRFFLFSNYFKKEPEILIDLPHKTVSGRTLPVFLLVKDADKYPVEILSIKFQFRLPNRTIITKNREVHYRVSSAFFSRAYHFDFPNVSGFCKVTAEIRYKIRGKIRYLINDNYTLKEKRLYTFLNDNEELFPSTMQGDLHVHSSYTADQVEFGALPKDIRTAAIAMNQQFTALTDHSYDLDDFEDNYLKNDPELRKFKAMQADCVRNSDSAFVLINGEEVTVRNADNRNVHLLALNDPVFFEGKGDGAEDWLNRHSRFTVAELVAARSPESLIIAAHPLTPTPLLEYLLIKRGEWQSADLLHPDVKVWQIMNGEDEAGFRAGLNFWIKQLLAGQQKFIAAGNDAHGNFAVFRQIKLPMFTMIREEKQLFGRWRTVVLNSELSKKAILHKISAGAAYITDGPHLDLTVSNSENSQKIGMGEELAVTDGQILCNLAVTSSLYSGKISRVTMIYGEIGSAKEIVTPISCDQAEHNFKISKKINFSKNGYLRVEIQTESVDRFGKPAVHQAFSNPVFIKRV